MTRGVKTVAALMDDGRRGDDLMGAARRLCGAFSDMLTSISPARTDTVIKSRENFVINVKVLKSIYNCKRLFILCSKKRIRNRRRLQGGRFILRTSQLRYKIDRWMLFRLFFSCFGKNFLCVNFVNKRLIFSDAKTFWRRPAASVISVMR